MDRLPRDKGHDGQPAGEAVQCFRRVGPGPEPVPGQGQIAGQPPAAAKACSQCVGGRLGVAVVRGSPRRGRADRGHLVGETPRLGYCQRLSLPRTGARLVQRGRQFGAHRSGLIHRGAQDVEDQGVNVISPEPAPTVSLARQHALTETAGEQACPSGC
jgi:hypothetical protein